MISYPSTQEYVCFSKKGIFMNRIPSHRLITFLCLALLAGIGFFYVRNRNCPAPMHYTPPAQTVALENQGEQEPLQAEDVYQPRTFDFKTVHGLSKKQLGDHIKLYQGYVKKSNEIAQALSHVDRSDTASSYSPLRALKIAETFALNGMILHELYFENLGTGTQPGPQTEKIIRENFGSFEQFRKDLITCASCARGWVMTGFLLYDYTVHNFVLDAHNETVPVLTIPLLVIDTYEHAYFIDFGVSKAEYLNLMWDTINWDVVEQRIEQWVNKFKTY
jgi:superoxide dismutase, Fe-Mn family